MQRKTTSISINPEIWRKFKIHCIKKQIKASDLVEELIAVEVENNGD